MNIRSTKADQRIHGLGLSSIRQEVERCGGLLELSYDDRRFQLEIVLFRIKRL
ncbi:GHKL domain-containing protein [Paenibacillus hodogayensis]|uniref:GHKL domain-containing protein n=1 Tax=Paenibacillus hodogayensis TaxID=279208 RepID=A0ABV5W1E9_9BACL